MSALFAELGIAIPRDPQLWTAGLALGVAILGWGVSALAGSTGGPPLAQLWERHAGRRSEGIANRMVHVVRDLTATILLGIAINAYSWPPLASLLLGLALGAAVALLIVELMRGLDLPWWMAALLAGIAFTAVLAKAAGGLAPVTGVLDQVGFDIGKRRISILSVLQITVTLLALLAGVKLINRIIGQSITRTRGLDPTQRLLAQKLAGVTVLVIAFFVGIDLIGIDITALAVFSGALGLAVGFGLQKTFGNLIAGIILLMDRSIKPGDVIVVGESFGSVNKIGVRAVSIITRDGKEHLIPNENLMTQEVENWSYSSRNVRVHIPVGVAYDSDLALAQRLMVEAAMASKRVLASPRPTVWLRAFGESSVDHEILAWIEDPEAGVGNVQSEILNRLWHLFKENGIDIPFPQRDLRIKEWPDAPPPPPPLNDPPARQ